jgi:opacity protein-like surface antigen
MKRKLLLAAGVLAVMGLATTAQARMQNKWYVGAGVNWVASSFENKYSLETEFGGVSTYTSSRKLTLQDTSAFGGNFVVGHTFDFMSWDTFLELGYGFDSSTSRSTKEIVHTVTTVDAGDERVNTVTNEVRRNHTYSLGVGVSKDISSTVSGYFKLSALLSQFDIINKIDKYEGDINNIGAVNRKKWTWGFAPTLGVSKELGSDFTVKLDYSYQIYGRLKHNATVMPRQIEASNVTNKIKPRYHIVNLGVTKSF